MVTLAYSSESKENGRQKKYFDKKTKERDFKVHDKVLLLLSNSTNKLLAEWKWPYEVIDQISPADYIVK